MVTSAECQQLIRDGAVGKGDSDISGLGVVIAFVLSACITFAAVLGAYVCGLVDDGLLRPVDKLVMRVPSRATQHPKVHVTLRKAIMTLSDQQIVTGIAIMGAGFSNLMRNQISVYHFHTVTYLAWMSSSVHLSALTLLRPYLNHHRGVLAWRFAGMLVLLAMLLVALVPTVSNDWAVLTTGDPDDWPGSSRNDFGVPALCFWGATYGDGVNPDAIISFLVLFVSYVWKMAGLFMPVRVHFDRYMRNPVDACLERPLVLFARRHSTLGSLLSIWTFRIYLGLYLAVTAVLEVLGSFTAALWLSALGLIYGIMQILIPRGLVQNYDSNVAQQESGLGFGQLMPLILLVQPLGACTEHLWLVEQDDEQVYQDENSSYAPQTAFTSARQPERTLELPKANLMEFMSRYTVPPLTAQLPEREHLKAILYKSKVFAALVWFVQVAIAGTAAFILSIDAFTIGWTRSESWYFISIAVAAYLGACLLLVLILAPHSRLGRPQSKIEAKHS